MKFGTNTAAEFDFLQPITKMTPIPFEVVQEIFPTDVKEETEKEVEEHTVSRETARNVAMLAEWEDDFDSIIDEDDDYDDNDDEMKMGTGRRMPKPGGRTMKRGRKRTPHKRPRKCRRESSSNSRRRESSIFSRERKSLIDPDDSMEVEDGDDGRGGSNDDNSNGGGGRGANGRDGGLPFSVTIDPEEYTSPSSTSVSADSVSTLGTPAALRAKNKESSSDNDAAGTSKMVPTKQCSNGGKDRDSLDSACISPSSLKSSLAVVDGNNNNNNDSTTTMVDTSFELKSSLTAVNDCNESSSSLDVSFESIVGRDSNDSNTTGKATPNSARTSSSTILRAVHASGALLPGNHHSPSQGGRRGVVPSSSTGNNVGRDGGNGRLRPNQLRYSPSSSSGSSTCPLKMVSLTKQCLQELCYVMQHFLNIRQHHYFPYHLSILGYISVRLLLKLGI